MSALSSAAFNASFDCSKAGTKIEKMICADDEISSLDERLGRAYKNARNTVADDDVFRMLQRQWIKNIRNRSGPPNVCVVMHDLVGLLLVKRL